MAKRLVDVLLSSAALALFAPVLIAAAFGILLSSPGPVLYRAKRVGIRGQLFTMLKLRTMRLNQGDAASCITANKDPRVFAFGSLLRRLKIDELPQLLNVLRGDMAIVGPRPEDPQVVADHYSPGFFETLNVRPGLASPGSIYNYTHGERMITGGNPEQQYIERVLPVKLALDLIYVRERSLAYDARVIVRTVGVIISTALGKRDFAEPPEMQKARRELNFVE